MGRNLTIAAIASHALLGGCAAYPCENDVLACEEGEAFEIDAHCEAHDPLTLEILESSSLEPVEPDAWPRVHHGAQGGIHFDLALRVHGLQADHLQLRASFEAMECTDEACADPVDVAARTLYADESVLMVEDDAAVLADVVLILDAAPRTGGQLVLRALDSCGREVEVVHAVSAN